MKPAILAKVVDELLLDYEATFDSVRHPSSSSPYAAAVGVVRDRAADGS